MLLLRKNFIFIFISASVPYLQIYLHKISHDMGLQIRKLVLYVRTAYSKSADY